MATKKQAEHLHQKGHSCVCIKAMTKFLDVDATSCLSSARLDAFHRAAMKMKPLTFESVNPSSRLELFTFLAHVCARCDWNTRIEKIIWVIEREWKVIHGPWNGHITLLVTPDYTLLASLFDDATRNGSYAVTAWFAKQWRFEPGAYVRVEHLFNVIKRGVKMKEWCEKDEQLIDRIFDILAHQPGWKDSLEEIYPRIQSIAIGVKDMRIKSRMIRWGLLFPEFQPTDKLVRHVIEDLDPASVTADDMEVLMRDSVHKNDGGVYLELDDSRPMATIVHNVLKLHEIPF